MLSYIAKASGAATLLDVRRWEDYDASKTVDAYLNQPHVKARGCRAVPTLTWPHVKGWELASGTVLA